MTIGDVLATVAGILTACASLWAAIVVTLLVFSTRTIAVADRIQSQPWRCAGVGTLVLLSAGLVTVILVNQPNGLFKLLGWLSLAFLLALATFGSAGLSRVVAQRIVSTDSAVPPFRAAGYGAGLLVATGLLPVLGWLILAVSLLTSLGAGTLTLKRKKKQQAEAPNPIAAVAPLAAEYARE
ncbi:MAG: hypothetical protein V4671_07465 [Armatimonadota bacterium]